MEIITKVQKNISHLDGDELTKILDSFIDNLKTDGTKREYRRDLKKFFEKMYPEIESTAGGLKRRHIIKYKKFLEEKKVKIVQKRDQKGRKIDEKIEYNLSSSSINKSLSSISAFCRFLAGEGLLEKDICYGVNRVDPERVYFTGYLKPHEVKEFFDSLDKKKKNYTKYKAILCFGFYMGLRASSVASIRIGHLGAKDGMPVCRYSAKRKKGLVENAKLMHPVLVKAVEEHKSFLKANGKNIEDKNLLLFSKYRFEKETPMTTQGIRKIFKTHFEKAGLKKESWTRYGSHVMRNTFSNELKRQNVPITEICEALDHANIQVTKNSYQYEENKVEKSPVTKITY